MPNLIGFIIKVSFHTFLACLILAPSSSSSLLPLPLLPYGSSFPPKHETNLVFRTWICLGHVWPLKTHFWVLIIIAFLSPNYWPFVFQFLFIVFWPHFGQIIKLFLSFITFRVSHFPVSHLTYETVKLGLQNTLNMSKTTRVYFGVLQYVSTTNQILFAIYYARFTMHYALCTIHYALYTIHYALYTMYYALFTMYYALCTMHYLLCTMYYLLCTMHYVYVFIRIHTYLLFYTYSYVFTISHRNSEKSRDFDTHA